MSLRLSPKVVRSAWTVGLFVVMSALLLQIGYYPDASDQALFSSQPRRLRSHRHARDEIDWPEGNNRHAHRARETAEESAARQELHRQAYLAEKRLPIALQRASREGNSKKDRARASAAEKRLGEIEHAVAKEKERLHVVDKDSHGLARYFPEVNLKEEEKVYAAMRGIRGKGKANHNKRAENIMAKQKRKAAFEALRDKNIREQYGFTTPGSEKFSDSSDELLRRPSTSTPTPINGTLDKYAPPWRKAQRQKFLKQQAANQDAASRAPEALKAVARQVYESRRVGRRERAAHLIADLEAQAADGEGPGARAAARHLRWISKLSSGVFAQWAEPLVVLIVRVHDAGAFDVDYRGKLAVQRAEEEAAAAQHEHGAQGAAALAAVDVMRRRVQLAEKARRKMVWPRLEASLRQLLAQLARVAYLGDEVDLEIVLELDPDEGQDEGGHDRWGLTRHHHDSTGNGESESASSNSVNDEDDALGDSSGEKNPEREGEGGKSRPLPSQVECLAAADRFVWPHGAMKVRIVWRTPPPPPLSPAAAAAARKRASSLQGPPGGVHKPPNIHLYPGGPIGKQAKKLAASTAAASTAKSEARRRSLLGLRQQPQEQPQQDQPLLRQQRRMLAKNSTKSKAGQQSSKDSIAGEEKEADDESADERDGILDPAAAAAREVRAFLKSWHPLGERGETAVFFDVTTPLPVPPLPSPLMRAEFDGESDWQSNNDVSSSRGTNSNTGDDLGDRGVNSMGSSTSSADHTFKSFRAAAEAGSSTVVDSTRVSPLFYAYLKAVLVHTFDQSNAHISSSTAAISNAASTPGIGGSGVNSVRVAGVALAPGLGTKGSRSTFGARSANATTFAGISSSSSGSGSSSVGGSSSGSQAAAPFYYLHEAGLGAGARVHLAPWDEIGSQSDEGVGGDAKKGDKTGFEPFSGPIALFSETWLAFRAHAELRLKHRKDLTVRFTTPAGTSMHHNEGVSDRHHHHHSHHGKTPPLFSPWAQETPDTYALSWQRLLLESMAAHRAAFFAAEFPYGATMALLRKPAHDVDSSVAQGTATTSISSSNRSGSSSSSSGDSKYRGLQHEKSVVTRWPGRDVLREDAPVLPSSFAALPVYGMQGNLEQHKEQSKVDATRSVANDHPCQALVSRDVLTPEWVTVLPADRRRSSKSQATHLLHLSDCLEVAASTTTAVTMEDTCADRRSFVFRNASACIRQADIDAALEAAAAAAAAAIAEAKAAKNTTAAAAKLDARRDFRKF